jgi:hypothetical protein
MKKIMFILIMAFAILSANAQTRTKIKTSDLQSTITNTIAKDYAGSTIKGATKIEKNGVISYEVLVVKGNEKSKLVFGKDGKFLRKEVFKTGTAKKEAAKPKGSSPEKKK